MHTFYLQTSTKVVYVISNKMHFISTLHHHKHIIKSLFLCLSQLLSSLIRTIIYIFTDILSPCLYNHCTINIHFVNTFVKISYLTIFTYYICSHINKIDYYIIQIMSCSAFMTEFLWLAYNKN